MLQFEAAAIWKRLQAAKAKGDKKGAQRLQRQYDKLLAHYPSEDEVHRRLRRLEERLGIVEHY
jgi:hypothetical protein